MIIDFLFGFVSTVNIYFNMFCLSPECRSVTDSVGSHSDASGHTTVTSHHAQRPRMDVVCVIDLHNSEHLAHRKRALEEVRQACALVNANMNHIQVNVHLHTSTKFSLTLKLDKVSLYWIIVL